MHADHDRRTDEELLAAVATEPAAFGLLYRRHVRVLLAYFARRTPGPEVAADLTAETFAAALAGRRSFDPARGLVRQWLFGIARTELATYHRRGAVEQRARRRLGMERLEPTPEELGELAALLDDAPGDDADGLLDGLPAEQADVVRARVLDEHDYPRIAADLGITEPAARQRASRGLAALRSRLATTKDPS